MLFTWNLNPKTPPKIQLLLLEASPRCVVLKPLLFTDEGWEAPNLQEREEQVQAIQPRRHPHPEHGGAFLGCYPNPIGFY